MRRGFVEEIHALSAWSVDLDRGQGRVAVRNGRVLSVSNLAVGDQGTGEGVLTGFLPWCPPCAGDEMAIISAVEGT
jgi:hypothetical protein